MLVMGWFLSQDESHISLSLYITISYIYTDVAAAKANADSGSAAAAGGDDDEYVPPKPEVENKITEDDALYTKRYVGVRDVCSGGGGLLSNFDPIPTI